MSLDKTVASCEELELMWSCEEWNDKEKNYFSNWTCVALYVFSVRYVLRVRNFVFAAGLECSGYVEEFDLS